MNFILKDSLLIDAEEWDRFIEDSPQGSPYTLFHTLSILKPGWQAIIAEKNGRWEAVFPFPVKKKYGISYCFQLPWTQHSGILFAPSDAKETEKLKKQKKLISGILDVVLKHATAIDLSLSPEINYPVPFLWKGFELKTRFTYQLDLTATSDPEEQFSPTTKNKIRKAKNAGFTVNRCDNISELVRHYKEEIGTRIGHLKHEHYLQLENLIRHLVKNDQAIALEARQEGHFVGGLVLYLFKDTSYFPINVVIPDLKSSGIMSLLLYESMLIMKERGIRTFDFEGSVIESVESFFRGFGALPVPFINIYRYPKWLKMAKQK